MLLPGAHNEKNTPRKERETPTHLIESADRAVGSRVTIFKPNSGNRPSIINEMSCRETIATTRVNRLAGNSVYQWVRDG